jgi:hypothetical protein
LAAAAASSSGVPSTSVIGIFTRQDFSTSLFLVKDRTRPSCCFFGLGTAPPPGIANSLAWPAPAT